MCVPDTPLLKMKFQKKNQAFKQFQFRMIMQFLVKNAFFKHISPNDKANKGLVVTLEYCHLVSAKLRYTFIGESFYLLFCNKILAFKFS